MDVSRCRLYDLRVTLGGLPRQARIECHGQVANQQPPGRCYPQAGPFALQQAIPLGRLQMLQRTGEVDGRIDVPALAKRAGLSERSFYRKFTDATGKTPAHFVETLRLDAARTLIAKGLPLKSVADKVGLRSSARLGAAFERRFGMAPSLFRQMHAAA